MQAANAEDAKGFADAIEKQLPTYEGRKVPLKSGEMIELSLAANPTDPGRSETYADEDVIDDTLQFVLEQLGAQEIARYPVLQLIWKVDPASLYLVSRTDGRITFGLTMKKGSSHIFEVEDLGYSHIEAKPNIEIDALPPSPPAPRPSE